MWRRVETERTSPRAPEADSGHPRPSFGRPAKPAAPPSAQPPRCRHLLQHRGRERGVRRRLQHDKLALARNDVEGCRIVHARARVLRRSQLHLDRPPRRLRTIRGHRGATDADGRPLVHDVSVQAGAVDHHACVELHRDARLGRRRGRTARGWGHQQLARRATTRLGCGTGMSAHAPETGFAVVACADRFSGEHEAGAAEEGRLGVPVRQQPRLDHRLARAPDRSHRVISQARLSLVQRTRTEQLRLQIAGLSVLGQHPR
eukprot:scaffold24105_cov113-Isochrysis_galbana.AAC.3